MKYISLFSILALYCCCSIHKTKQTDVNIEKLLKEVKVISSAEADYSGDVGDTFNRWRLIWDTVFVKDAAHRSKNGECYLTNTTKQNKLDSINLAYVTYYLNMYGFPSRKQSGTIGLFAITNVIQHAPVALQEKYYTVWIDSYINGNLPGAYVALLEDRINMSRLRKQYYGTQHFHYDDGEDYLYPVVNPDSINAWRMQLGIEQTIESEYDSLYKKRWNTGDYKRGLPGLVKKFNVTDSPSIRFVKQP